MATAAPAIPYKGARAPPKVKQGPGVIIAVGSWIAIGLIPTIIYGFWQLNWVFNLIETVGDIAVPGRGGLLRWLALGLFFIFNSMIAISIGGGKKVGFPGPDGKIPTVYPEWPGVIFKISLYYITVIILPIMFGKPIIANWVVQPLVNGLVATNNADLAFAIADTVQVAGMDVTLPKGQAEKSVEDRLCGGYIKRNDKGQEIKGGKLVDVTFASDDVPPWTDGKSYRATIRINNLGDETIYAVVVAGKPSKTYKKDDKITGIGEATGSYISGTKTVAGQGDRPQPIVYPIYPLDDCFEVAKGCEIVPGIEKTVEVYTRRSIPDTGTFENLVSFEQNTRATLNVQLKLNYFDDNKKATGTGHLLIFADNKNAIAKQKDSSFKSNYCPITGQGPLDVVVTPPFYTVGKGYFQSPEKECKADGLPWVGGFCLNNIKSVKIKLKNTDQENARIQLKSLKVFPAKTTFYYYIPEKGASGNCFLDGYDQGTGAVSFSDESGLIINKDNEKGTPAYNFEQAIPYFRTDTTFTCKYQIQDSPNRPLFAEFKDFLFRAEAKYDYIADFQKPNILQASKEQS